ncbi:MAG: FecR domain-containing protein [Burkholderiaceae bacterium]|nr:FecR domain-containing protein [Burkholderiaceae bacterium]
MTANALASAVATLATILVAMPVARAQPLAPADAQRPVAPLADAELIYRAQRGDTLIGIGARLLARPGDWREVARLNRLPDPDRILPAQPIRIPLRLLRGEPVPATVLDAVGEVRLRSVGAATSAASAVTPGAALPEGARVITGDDGYVTLRLVDGSTLRVQAASEVELAQSRQLGPQAQGGHRSRLDLLRGRMEVLVDKMTGGTPRFEVRTPQAVVGVRGTEFRVAAADGLTRSEVLTGRVAVGSGASADAQAVDAGFGTRSDGRRVEPPAPLLPAPAVDALPTRVERVLVQMPLTPVSGAVAYRVQIAPDAAFRRVAAEGRFDRPELRFDTLDDGDYLLRVRAIDAAGLEGRDAVHAFRLKARPQPPAVLAPAPQARLPAPRVTLAWAAHPQARHYRLQLARADDFAAPERSFDALTDTTIAVDLAPGLWHWRVATVRAVTREGRVIDDAGPWGDAQRFELRALPLPPAPPQIDSRTVRIAWGGAPGQQFDFELAADAGFAQPLLARRVDAPQIGFDRPPPGRYFIRYRAIDADGYVGPFIDAQVLTLLDCVRDGSGGCIASGADVLRSP